MSMSTNLREVQPRCLCDDPVNHLMHKNNHAVGLAKSIKKWIAESDNPKKTGFYMRTAPFNSTCNGVAGSVELEGHVFHICKNDGGIHPNFSHIGQGVKIIVMLGKCYLKGNEMSPKQLDGCWRLYEPFVAMCNTEYFKDLIRIANAKLAAEKIGDDKVEQESKRSQQESKVLSELSGQSKSFEARVESKAVLSNDEGKNQSQTISQQQQFTTVNLNRTPHTIVSSSENVQETQVGPEPVSFYRPGLPPLLIQVDQLL